MTMPRPPCPGNRSVQQGATLFLTLIMLVVITIISLATLGTSLMELRMSNNAESSMSSQQEALSAIDNVVKNAEANFTVTGAIGHTNCTPGLSCTENTIVLPAPFDNYTEIMVTRESESMCPIPLLHFSTSCTSSKAASFKVYSNRGGLGQGRSELNQGYISVFPFPPGAPPSNESALHN